MLLNKLLYCTVKNGRTQPYGLSLCLIPTSEPVQTVICISKIQKTKGIVQRNAHRWTTYSESCLLIFFGVCTQKYPASTLRCSRKFAIHFRLWIKCFFIKVQMLNGRIMFVGYNWYQTPHSLTCLSSLFYWHRNCKSTSCHQSWNTIFWCHEQVCSEIQRNILCWFHSKMGCMERMQASKMEYHFRISSLGTNGAPTAMCTQTTPFQSFFESPQPWG